MSEAVKTGVELPRTKITELHAFIARVMKAVGLSPTEADTVGKLMAEADARGADGHGVFRLPQYVKRIQSGGINTRPKYASCANRRRWRWWMATMPWAIW